MKCIDNDIDVTLDVDVNCEIRCISVIHHIVKTVIIHAIFKQIYLRKLQNILN